MAPHYYSHFNVYCAFKTLELQLVFSCIHDNLLANSYISTFALKSNLSSQQLNYKKFCGACFQALACIKITVNCNNAFNISSNIMHR